MDYEIRFEESERPPVRLASGENLSEHLTVENSPILFGCRTGICGTCAIEVLATEGGELSPRTPDEEELLSVLAPNRPSCRLACQLRLEANLKIRKVSL